MNGETQQEQGFRDTEARLRKLLFQACAERDALLVALRKARDCIDGLNDGSVTGAQSCAAANEIDVTLAERWPALDEPSCRQGRGNAMTRPPSPAPFTIRAARVAAGLTQTAAGALIYTPLRTWQEWEYGRRPMHAAMWELWQGRARKHAKQTTKHNGETT